MATVLENYGHYKQTLAQSIAQGGVKADALWRYGELTYRISVLETCQAYCKSAPVCTDMNALSFHYKMLDAYIQCLALERAYGPNRGQNTEKEREAAKMNLGRVIQDYRRRFSGFAPTTEASYSQEIGKVISALMPAWLQLRETFVPLREEKTNGK